ncbi:MAG: N-(5'-phosphoribosyl)anthranilate isomerase [Dehalococcoidia bacterium]|nr:N-(5'-phosphoribosyl)anthranilate isomerase [Dehalococcoidia bacterium]
MNSKETKVKICGIKDTNILKKINNLKIDYLGINFIENSKRYIEKELAIKISEELRLSSKKINLVGLFQDHDIKLVNKIIDLVKLDYVQLCGKESTEYVKAINSKTIKVIHIKESDNVEDVESKIKCYLAICDNIILDTHSKKSSGGTGKVFNWKKYSSLFSKNIFVAGGLNPINVSEIISIYKPWGVDVSSGVESNGIKDFNKIRKFIDHSKV